jgi:hypothetical protein
MRALGNNVQCYAGQRRGGEGRSVCRRAIVSCIWTGARHGGCSKIKMLAGAGARWLVDRLEWTPLPVVSRRPGLSCAVARMRNRTAIPVSDNLHPRCHCAINTISVTVSAGRTKVIELRQQGCEIMLDAAALNFLLFILARGPGSAGPLKVDAACQPSHVTGLVPLTVPGCDHRPEAPRASLAFSGTYTGSGVPSGRWQCNCPVRLRVRRMLEHNALGCITPLALHISCLLE